MRGLLERQLSEYGFRCVEADEKEELYFLETGKSAALFIEGKCEPHEEYGEEFYYNFYKQTWYEKYPNEDKTLGEHLDCLQIVERVKRYFINRDRYIAAQQQKKGRYGTYGMGSKRI